MRRVVTVIVVMAATFFCFHISTIGIIVGNGGIGVIRKFSFNRLGLSLLLLMMGFAQAWAQTSLKDISVNYGMLRLDKGYSIIYDNSNEAAKLNEFRIKFYKDATFIDETVIEAFPLNGTITPYDLTHPIIGFNRAELSIISLHSGSIADFPSSAASIIALNEPKEIDPDKHKKTLPEPVNQPPLASDAFFQIEATSETVTRSLADQFSDPDNDPVTAVKITKAELPLSYAISTNGTLALAAPSITGTYEFPYIVKDSQGASASAEINITVVVPETMEADLVQYEHSVGQLLSKINEQKTKLETLGVDIPSLIDRREKLLTDNKALEKQLSDPKLSDLKNDLLELTKNLEASKKITSIEDDLVKTEDLNTRALALQSELETLKSQQAQNGLDVTSFQTKIDNFDDNLTNLRQEENILKEPTLLTALQMEKWEAQHHLIKQKIPSPSFNWALGILMLLALVGFVFWVVKTQLKFSPNRNLEAKKKKDSDRKDKAIISFPVTVVRAEGARFISEIKKYPEEMNNYDSQKGELDIPEPSGIIFPENPSFQSKEIASQQAVPGLWETIYDATGRIGLAQKGKPVGNEDCLGTALLVGPNYIMTNLHVFDRYYDRITEPEELIGVEFYGEVNSDKTEFYKISCDEIYILEERDAIILKLETAVNPTHRQSVKFSTKPPEAYVEDDIMIVGYPIKPNLEDLPPDQRDVFQDIKIFSVKRYSEGRIFSHQNDTDKDFIVETKTSGKYALNGYQPAISHDVSALPGNSGSPIFSKNTGDIIGLHFGDGRFKKYPANVGHTSQILAGFVTLVTSGQARNMIDDV